MGVPGPNATITPTIRLATPDDADGVRAIYAPFVRDTTVSLELSAPSTEEMRRRIDRTTERHPWLVADVDGTVAGYAYARPHRKREAYQWAVETSVYVHQDYRRSGLARGLYTSLFEVLALQGFVTAYAGIVIPNAASVAFHRSMGFDPFCTYEAVGHKQGAWRDVQWYQRRLGDLPDEPAPPDPIAEVRSRESWDEAVSAGHSSIDR